MFLRLPHATIYADTAGAPIDPTRPTALLLHGVLNDHSVWAPPARALAASGWNVLAPDLPGHGQSTGLPPSSVTEAARWALALLDAAGVQRAALVGHSLGSLIALEAAALAPQRTSHLALLATAAPMRVNPALLAAAAADPVQMIDTVARYSHNRDCPPDAGRASDLPPIEVSRALMQRVLASHPEHNAAVSGFTACDRYAGAEAALARVRCPVLFVIGSADHMTPPRSARALAAQAPGARIVEVPTGHAMLLEAPTAVSQALLAFLAAPAA